MKIFRHGSKSLEEIREIRSNGKSFDVERTIQNLMENHLSTVFTGLELVDSEYVIEDLRIDTVAFDEEKRSFAIIEYKNVKNRSLTDQGVSYYLALQDNRADFVLLYNNKKGKSYNVKDIRWDEVRIIFISPTFDKYQLRASGFQGLPIELYEIRQFEDGIITLNKIEGKSKTMQIEKTRKTKRAFTKVEEYSEEDYLRGTYNTPVPSPETRKLYFSMKDMILETFNDIEFKPRKKYVGFYSEDGASICSLLVTKNKLIVIYSTTKGRLHTSDFVHDASEKGHWGVGHFKSDIRNEDDIRKALEVIKKVYEIKTKS